MQTDTGLVYCRPDWQETLQLFEAVEDNNKKMLLEPYPDEKVLAVFAKLSYTACTGELNLPKGWQLLTTARNNSWTNGYFGCAFWNPSEQQVVVAHRGTVPKKLGTLWVDWKGVYCNSYTNHMNSGVTFADEIKKVILETNQRHGSRFVLSFTGHSLGAWLAGVTTLTVKYLERKGSGFHPITSPREGLHAHTLALDSPGVEEMLLKICRDTDVRYNRFMSTKYLDITTIFVAPNLINTFGWHVGDIYQVHMKRAAPARYLEGITSGCNLDTHSIDNFLKAFDEGKEKYAVHVWPQGHVELEHHHELELISKSYFLHMDEIQVPSESSASSSGSHRSTQPAERNAGSMDSQEIAILQYDTIQSLGNACHLGVFSTEEFKFLQNWSLFKRSLMKRTEIKKFLTHQKLENIDIPEFKMDSRKNTIHCKSKGGLVKAIGQTKQLLRWFPAEIMKAVEQQNKSIKGAPLYMAGQAYLRTLPDILDCEDTLGLEPFLGSSERILLIETNDPTFEAARINNILLQVKNTSLNSIYLQDICHTILSWNDLTGIAKYIDVEGLNEKDVIINNLLVLVFTSTVGDFNQNDEILTKIFKTSETSIHKKFVIVLSQPIDLQLSIYFKKLTVETKSFKKFGLSDLTITSREDIFARDAIAIGKEILSLNTLLGDDCKSDDEQVRNKINRLISPILKKLAIDPRYRAIIPIKLPKLCSILFQKALYSKAKKLVDEAKIVALLERSEADGPLLVISDPEQLSQDYWGEAAESVRGRTFISAEGQDLFMEKCREESARVIYWLHLCEEGLTLKEVYNNGLYMPRKFHTRFIIKSMDEFVRYSGNKDIFIFNNVKDKLSLISSFNISKEGEEVFVSKEHFKLNTEDITKEETFSKHYFEKLKIRGSPCLVWQYSHGSLDGLRPFITRDYSDPTEEDAVCNTKKKLTIIADDPGMEKTTSLTRMSGLIRDSWVLRIDHNHLTAIDKLPSKLNLQSVTKYLIHASGLPNDDDLLDSLLQHSLESNSSRRVCILLDAFDEISKENIKVKLLKVLKYLKNTTNCKTVVTTRVHPQEWLENELSEFSAELGKITEREQDDYMMKSWLPHLALELPDYGETEKRRLRQFARELRGEVKGVLGEDVASFIGIPLQIRLLAEVFLQQAIQTVVSPEADIHIQCNDGWTALMLATSNGCLEVVKLLLLKGADIHMGDNYGVTALMLAASNGCPEVVELLLLKGADIYVQCNDGWTALMLAASNGCLEVIELLLLKGADIYMRNNDGVTALMLAASNGCLEVVDLLLLEGADIHVGDNDDMTALMLAARNGYLEVVELLLLKGADIHVGNNVGWTALMLAANEGHLEVVEILLLKGADIHMGDNDGWTALMLAASNGCLEVIELLLLKVADIYMRNNDGVTALMLAASNGCLELVDLLLLEGADINMGDNDDMTALMLAARNGHLEVVELLLLKGADIHVGNNDGWTALMLAANEGHLEVVEILLLKGADIDVGDNDGWTALMVAASNGCLEVVELLQLKGADIHIGNNDGVTALMLAASNGCLEIVELLLLKGTDIHIGDNDGMTALMIAASKRHLEVVKLLLLKGADIRISNTDGWTALMLAANKGYLEVVEFLLLKGADNHMKSNADWTALNFAAAGGYLKVAKLLLPNGADLNSRDEDKDTAFLLAATNGHTEMVVLLLRHGVEVNSQRGDGRTALSWAALKGHVNVVEVLLQHNADVSCQDKDGKTALSWAEEEGHVEVMD